VATSVWSSPLDHSGNAGFQAWYGELLAQLIAINAALFVQHTDTGQLGAGAARPAINTAAGYWIFKFDDGQTILYFKIEPGTGASAGIANMWLTVGTGTNGSGTLTGIVTVRSPLTVTVAALSAVTNYTSYLCVVAGAVSLGWKTLSRGPSTQSGGYFGVYRSVSDAGALNNDGFVQYTGLNTGQFAQSVNLTNGTIFSGNVAPGTTNGTCMIPYGITSSVVSGNAQYFRHFAVYPLARPIVGVVSVIAAEYPTGTSFAGESGSITDHTYVSLGLSQQQASNLVLSGIAFIFE
jgi:hypothetical protein